jgi:hypothetical protein
VDSDTDADTGPTTWYRDVDGDGYGDALVSYEGEEGLDGYVDKPGDCNDNDAEVNPDALEFWGDSVDNDCDGSVDETDDFEGDYVGEFSIAVPQSPATLTYIGTTAAVVLFNGTTGYLLGNFSGRTDAGDLLTGHYHATLESSNFTGVIVDSPSRARCTDTSGIPGRITPRQRSLTGIVNPDGVAITLSAEYSCFASVDTPSVGTITLTHSR